MLQLYLQDITSVIHPFLQKLVPGNYNRKDNFYRKAKEEGYRSRAAYKLIEIDKKHRLFRPGMSVLDLGSFPGGWLQVALEKVGPKGKVLGIDLREIAPVSAHGCSASIIQGDILGEDTRGKIIVLAGGKVDIILSDLSPQLSGIKFRDCLKCAELVETALSLARIVLKNGGSLLAKIFPGVECEELVKIFKVSFEKFSRSSLDSSRKTSTELYLIGKGFKENK